MIHYYETSNMRTPDDPIFRSNGRQLLEGLAWGVGVAVITFTMFGHTWREFGTQFFFVHFSVVTSACTAIYFTVRKSQQRLQRWLRTKRQ